MFRRIFAVAAIALVATGCDSNNSPSIAATPTPAPEPTFSVQVLHASSDAPAVNVVFNDAAFAEGADYKDGSGRAQVVAGTYPVQVDALLPTGPAPVIGPVNQPFDADLVYTIVAVGNTAAGSATPLEPIVLAQPRTDVTAGNARIYVLHAASVAQSVDVYVTAPDADITVIDPDATFTYKGEIGPLELPARDYRIRVTAPGADEPLYDSGTIPLADGDDFFLAAVNNVGPGESPISLVALTGSGSAEFPDVNNTAAFRVTHASPDVGPVDVLIDDVEFIGDRVFTSVTDFTEVPPTTYNVKVTAANNDTVVPIDADLELVGGTIYDIIAVGEFGNDSIEALVETDDPRPLGTNAKVRLIHASPSAGDVDIYVTARDAGIADVEPLLPAVPFTANTGFLGLDAGQYDVSITPTGTKTIAIGPVPLDLANGDVLTAIARDADGGGLPNPADGVIVLPAF